MPIGLLGTMIQIEDYTQEELIALYKRLDIYATTWWFKYFRMYKMNPEEKEKPIIQYNIEKTYSSLGHYYYDPRPVLAYVPVNDKDHYREDIRITLIDYDLRKYEQEKEKYHREILKLKYERACIDCMYRSIWWCGGKFDEYVDKYNNGLPEMWLDPEELEVELHMNDEYRIRSGLATDIQMYQFVWNTLQYLNIEQLTKLLKFADKGVENKWENISMTAGRKSRKGEIRQVDIETGEVVRTYTTRNELIEELGIKKSHLSQCIKTSKENPNSRNEWKKWIGEDGKKYGFVESFQSD